jgi:hypothetical protein
MIYTLKILENLLAGLLKELETHSRIYNPIMNLYALSIDDLALDYHKEYSGNMAA